MENDKSERENYIKQGTIISCMLCIVGILFNLSKIALVGAIMLVLVQVVDLIWFIIEIKFKDCENIKQAFCRCKDLEITDEWDGIDTKFGRCVKCGKYFMINERNESAIKISKEQYEKERKLFNIMLNSLDDLIENIEKLDLFKKEETQKENEKEKEE